MKSANDRKTGLKRASISIFEEKRKRKMKSILKNNMYIFAFGIIFAVPATFLLTPANTLLGIGYFLIFLFLFIVMTSCIAWLLPNLFDLEKSVTQKIVAICSIAVSIVTWISCQSFFHGTRAFLSAYGIIFAIIDAYAAWSLKGSWK